MSIEVLYYRIISFSSEIGLRLGLLAYQGVKYLWDADALCIANNFTFDYKVRAKIEHRASLRSGWFSDN